MAEKNVLDREELVKIINYIINLILKLESPSEDNDTLQWKDEVNLNFKKQKPLHLIISNFFKKTFEKLEIIKKQIDDFKSNNKKQIDDFKSNNKNK